MLLSDFVVTRPKPAYCRQGLDWIVRPEYSFRVFKIKKHKIPRGTMKNHENPPGSMKTMKNQPGTMAGTMDIA